MQAVLKPLKDVPLAECQAPIDAIVEALAMAGAHNKGAAARAAQKARRIAGARHGQRRARLAHYVARMSADEYNLLRQSMWGVWHQHALHVSVGALWLHRQLDAIAKAALDAFDAQRTGAQDLQTPVADIGLSGPLRGGLGDPF